MLSHSRQMQWIISCHLQPPVSYSFYGFHELTLSGLPFHYVCFCLNRHWRDGNRMGNRIRSEDKFHSLEPRFQIEKNPNYLFLKGWYVGLGFGIFHFLTWLLNALNLEATLIFFSALLSGRQCYWKAWQAMKCPLPENRKILRSSLSSKPKVSFFSKTPEECLLSLKSKW